MSLEIIESIKQAEKKAEQIIKDAQQQAQEIIANATAAAQASASDSAQQFSKKAEDIIKKAEQQALQQAEAINEQVRADCEKLTAAAEKNMEKATLFVVEKLKGAE